jgi:hypothetical protein
MMKKIIITSYFLITIGLLSFGQSADPIVSKCALSAGDDAKYVKDYRIQLGKALTQSDLRYKDNISLWKNTKYRFTLCSTEGSKGQLIFDIKDDANKIVVSSFDKKTGKTYTSIDFICQKSGKYQISYDFTNGQQGSGVGIVSMIK